MSGETFEALLTPHLRLVRSLVNSRLKRTGQAEDVVQEVLMRAFACRNQLRTNEKFRNWLWSITWNEVRMFHRRDRRMASLTDFPNLDRPDPSISPLARLERMETRDRVRAGIARLSAREQKAIQLCDMEGRSLREVAAALHRSESAAKSVHFRARRRLGQLVRADGAGSGRIASRPAA